MLHGSPTLVALLRLHAVLKNPSHSSSLGAVRYFDRGIPLVGESCVKHQVEAPHGRGLGLIGDQTWSLHLDLEGISRRSR
jgi:hypothetical protein